MKHVLLGVVALALSGCSDRAEKTYTVDELVADEALLATVIGKCRKNPGALRETPNCRNAEAADGRLRLERMRKALGG